MSKVVKGVGRAVKKVVGGISNGIKSIWNYAKDSKILKAVAIAAAVYFT